MALWKMRSEELSRRIWRIEMYYGQVPKSEKHRDMWILPIDRYTTRSARVSVAYQEKEERTPESSSRLVLDPFACGRPMQYVTSGTGWLLTSVGPDCIQDIKPEDYESESVSSVERLLRLSYDPTNGLYSRGDLFQSREKRQFEAEPIPWPGLLSYMVYRYGTVDHDLSTTRNRGVEECPQSEEQKTSDTYNSMALWDAQTRQLEEMIQTYYDDWSQFPRSGAMNGDSTFLMNQPPEWSLVFPGKYVDRRFPAMLRDPFTTRGQIQYTSVDHGSTESGWLLWCSGPDCKLDIRSEHYSPFSVTSTLCLVHREYDPTNGACSSGDVFDSLEKHGMQFYVSRLRKDPARSPESIPKGLVEYVREAIHIESRNAATTTGRGE